MRGVDDMRFSLIPETGVEIINGKMIAKSLPIWLRLEATDPIRPNTWLRLRYRSSYFDDNVRPLIRFMDHADQSHIQAMNGTLFGVGEWVGYIPEHVTSISISPVNRTGPFGFRVERIDYISPLRLLLQGLLSNPLLAAWAIGTRLIGANEEARRALKFASTSTSLTEYNEWSRRLSRHVDADGIDCPRADWNKTSHFRLFMSVDGIASRFLRSTVQSLRSQLYSRWSLHYLVDHNCAPEQQLLIRGNLNCDPRISEIANANDLAAFCTNNSNNDFCTLISAGDVLPDYALAAVAELQTRHPAAAVVYGDEDSISSSGELHSPTLNPDWSPYFFAGRRYVANPIFLRARELVRFDCANAIQFLTDNEGIVASILGNIAKDSVHHIRRVLCHHGRELTENSRQLKEAAQLRITTNSLAQYPEVRVILLTRDNADCLAECIKGLTNITDYPHLRITLIDNGSVKPDSLALMRELKRHSQIDILERPGPFNFSALCNEAALNSQEPVIVFLNDDIAMRNREWLKPLVYWATRPDVGIAGAKLLFPNGSLQHAGVILGLGGIAAHIYNGQDARQAGYLGRLRVPHEVEAVTAACIAIERRKFITVGGFDADNLPVELNDIDLCLRLSERGFTTIWTPESVLTHHESATRGKTPWSSEIYGAQRAYFIERWQTKIRDDRFFHPDLSLFSYKPALA
jgi:O-antigen biosynthesis protein